MLLLANIGSDGEWVLGEALGAGVGKAVVGEAVGFTVVGAAEKHVKERFCYGFKLHFNSKLTHTLTQTQISVPGVIG